MLCLPRIISNESEIENTLVPPCEGAYPRSPRDQYPVRNCIELNPQLMQSLVVWFTIPGGWVPQALFKSAPRSPIFAASQLLFPKDRMMLKIRLKPPVIWLMLWSLKMWVSEITALRAWLVMLCVLANAPCSANPGEPPGTNEDA